MGYIDIDTLDRIIQAVEMYCNCPEMTVREIAELCGVSPKTMARYVRKYRGEGALRQRGVQISKRAELHERIARAVEVRDWEVVDDPAGG